MVKVALFTGYNVMKDENTLGKRAWVAALVAIAALVVSIVSANRCIQRPQVMSLARGRAQNRFRLGMGLRRLSVLPLDRVGEQCNRLAIMLHLDEPARKELEAHHTIYFILRFSAPQKSGALRRRSE
jgi:hypothetical protein